MSCEIGEACGLFGSYRYDGKPVAQLLYWGLVSQNHRGHQSHGFLTFDGKFRTQTRLGLLPSFERFISQGLLEKLPGSVGMGHVRYATSGLSDERQLIKDAQPYVERRGKIKLGIGYNGNIVNSIQLRRELKKKFGSLRSSSDAELICKRMLLSMRRGDLRDAAEDCMKNVEGSFSTVGLDGEGRLFAFRDPYGIKPLCYGGNDDVSAVSSESVGLSINDIQYKGEVKPGELLIWSEDGPTREQIVKCKKRAFCSFEYAYFARPDSLLDGGRPVYKVREEFGRNLGRENPDIVEKVDVIISIPETADDAAYGLHLQTGIPWERALRKHRYVTARAFITSSQRRDMIINKKINVNRGAIRGKRVAIVEDSIVRGDTSMRVVKKIKEAGAKEIHMFITFPRIISPCFYGIDMATFEELIGANHKADEIAKIIGVDSVNYQSIDGFVKATGWRRKDLCLGCITGRYPTPMAQEMADRMKSKFEEGEKETGRIYETE